MNRRSFLKTIGGVIAGAILAPLAIAQSARRVYGGISWLPDGTKVYSGPHYDRIDVMPGERVLIASTVKTIGVVNVMGGHLLPSERRGDTLAAIYTVNIYSGSVGFTDSKMSAVIGGMFLGTSLPVHRLYVDSGTIYRPFVYRDRSRRVQRDLYNAARTALA